MAAQFLFAAGREHCRLRGEVLQRASPFPLTPRSATLFADGLED